MLLLGELSDRIDGHFAEELLHQQARGCLDRSLEQGIDLGIAIQGGSQDPAEHFELADELIDLITILPAHDAMFLSIVHGVSSECGGVASAQEVATFAVDLGEVIDELLVSQAIGCGDLGIAAHGQQSLIRQGGLLSFEITGQFR